MLRLTGLRTVSVLALGAMLASGAPAVAQTGQAAPEGGGSTTGAPVPAPADQQPEAADSGYQISDIIVTAQRREESLSRVGISVAAIGADQLQARGVTTPADLVKIVPGFQASTTYGGNPVYTLRGVGFNTRNAVSTAPVGIYMDEAAVPYPYMSVGLVHDLERVEVLKGPQGTLYGRNATGGLINYVAARPTSTYQGGFGFEAGSYGTLNANAFVSGPLFSGLNARLAVNSLNRGKGFQRSITRDEALGKLYQKAARLTLATDGAGPFSMTLTGDYWKRDGDTLGVQATLYIPDVNPALAPFANARARASIQANPRNVRDVDFFSKGLQLQTAQGLYWPGPLTDTEFYSGVAKLGLAFSAAVRLQSLTSYHHLNQRDVSDAAGVQTASLGIDSRSRIKSFAQELRLIGESERLNWSIGGYYADDSTRTSELGYNTENVVVQRFRAFSLLVPSLYTVAERLGSFGNFRNESTSGTQVLAGFANAEYRFSDLFKVTLGGRYTNDRTRFTGCTYDTNGGNLAFVNTIYNLFGVTADITANQCYTLNRAGTNFVPGPIGNKIDQNNFAWRAGVDLTPSDTTLLYASVSRGFKSGGFPVLAASNEAQFDPIRQERLTAYELGTKLGLLDRRVQLNLAAFYYDYKDKQIYGRVFDQIFSTLSRIVNAPRSRLFGVEGDVTWRLTPALTLRLAGSYLDSKILEFRDFTELALPVPPATVAAQIDIRGQPFTYTPKFQGTGGLGYDGPVGDGGIHVIADGNISYQTRSQSDSAGIPQFAIKAYELVDGSIGIRSRDGGWRVQLYGKNLFDRYYWVGVASGTETVFRFPGMPRELGVRAAFRF